MSKSGAIRAGEAYTELHADKSPMERELKLGEAVLKRFGAKISGLGEKLVKVSGSVLGIEGIAALFEKLRGAAEPTAALLKLSQQTGMTVEAIGEMSHAAKSAGVDVETFMHATGHMQKFLVEAATGSQEAKFALAQLGLTVGKLATMTPDKQLEAIGEQLMKIPDPAVRTAVAMQVLGKAGAEMIPMFARGTQWMAAQRAEAIALGRKTREQAEAAKAFSDALDKLLGSVSQVTGALVGALGPAVKLVADYVNPIALAIAQWIRKNKELIATASLVALAVAGVGAALIGIGHIVAGAIPGLTMLWGAVVATFGAIGVVISAVASPIGIVVAAVIGLGLYFGTTSGAIGAAVTFLIEQFNSLAAYFAPVWQGIKDAIAAGDIALAFQLVGAQIKLEWSKALFSLNQVFISAGQLLINAAIDTGVQIYSAFWSVADSVGHAFDGIFTSAQKAFNDVAAIAEKALAYAQAIQKTALAAVDNAKGKLTELISDPLKFVLGQDKGNGTHGPLIAHMKDIAGANLDAARAAFAEAGDKSSAADMNRFGKNTALDSANSARDRQLDAGMQAKAAFAAMIGGALKVGVGTQATDAHMLMAAKDASDVMKAQADLDKKMADAAAARNKGQQLPTGQPVGDKLTELATQVRTRGVGGQDVRTAEGFRSFAASLRQSRDNPQKEAAKTLKEIQAANRETARDIRRTRELAERDVAFNF